MTLIALPVWTDSSGTDTGPMNLRARTDTPIAQQIEGGFQMARRAGGINARVLVIDDVTWQTVARLRARNQSGKAA